MDTIIRVDRSVRPAGGSAALFPELAGVGPSEYDFEKDVRQWVYCHDWSGHQPKLLWHFFFVDPFAEEPKLQIDSRVDVESLLSFHDLQAIKEKGPEFCGGHLLGASLLGLRSAVRSSDGGLSVPVLTQYTGGKGEGPSVSLSWSSTYSFMGMPIAAARFRQR